MIWGDNLKDNPPDRFFNKEKICPICGESLDSDKHNFKDGTVPYLRFRDEFHFCHIECYVMLYKCLKRVLEKYPDDALVGAI